MVPATAYLEALLSLARRRQGSASAAVSDISIEEALLLDSDGTTRTLQWLASPAANGAISVSLSSAASDEVFRRHVAATLIAAGPINEAAPSLADARSSCPTSVAVAEHYAGFERRGLDFGPDFRVVRELWSGPGAALGRIELSDALAREAGSYAIHPVLLDGCLQVLAAAISDPAESLYLPIAFGSFTLRGSPGARCLSHVRVQAERDETRRADVTVFDEAERSLPSSRA